MRPRSHDKLIGQRIAKARKAQGLTLRNVAERLDWPVGTLGNFETGRRSLTVSHLYAIATALNHSPAAFLMDDAGTAALVDALAADDTLAMQVRVVMDALAADVPEPPDE